MGENPGKSARKCTKYWKYVWTVPKVEHEKYAFTNKHLN